MSATKRSREELPEEKRPTYFRKSYFAKMIPLRTQRRTFKRTLLDQILYS